MLPTFTSILNPTPTPRMVQAVHRCERQAFLHLYAGWVNAQMACYEPVVVARTSIGRNEECVQRRDGASELPVERDHVAQHEARGRRNEQLERGQARMYGARGGYMKMYLEEGGHGPRGDHGGGPPPFFRHDLDVREMGGWIGRPVRVHGAKLRRTEVLQSMAISALMQTCVFAGGYQGCQWWEEYVTFLWANVAGTTVENGTSECRRVGVLSLVGEDYSVTTRLWDIPGRRAGFKWPGGKTVVDCGGIVGCIAEEAGVIRGSYARKRKRRRGTCVHCPSCLWHGVQERDGGGEVEAGDGDGDDDELEDNGCRATDTTTKLPRGHVARIKRNKLRAISRWNVDLLESLDRWSANEEVSRIRASAARSR
ncbi:hypothetical protein FB451DRAFT_1365019 [Mycena latifolia]|nr:hypothetical protein FB451DRAFT_1365019 [Mycena latifolia]